MEELTEEICEQENSRYTLNSVDCALSILNLYFEHEELGTTEVARLTGISRSTAFRFLVTLENRGFLTKNKNGKYRLGLNMFSLGMLAYNRMELAVAVHPILEDMAKISGETCHVAIMDGAVRVIFIDRALGTSWLKMDTALGYSQYAHCTATGKAMLAYGTPEALKQYLKNTTYENRTRKSIRNEKELLEILEEVRRKGYAWDDEEAEEGLTCYAKPLIDGSGRVYAAISISGPTTRMLQKREEHLQLLTEAVKRINSASGLK